MVDTSVVERRFYSYISNKLISYPVHCDCDMLIISKKTAQVADPEIFGEGGEDE